MSENSSWWAIVVRLASFIEGEEHGSIEEYSIRIISEPSLEQAKLKALRYAKKSNPDSLTTDQKTIRTETVSIVGAEFLGDTIPKDGDEIWSRLAFLDREEDQGFQKDSPPFWALRAFHTDWNIKNLEERC